MDAKHNTEKPPAEETVAQTTRLDKDHTKVLACRLRCVIVLVLIILIYFFCETNVTAPI